MRVTFASIVLNEGEYLAKNIAQHQEFCDEWIIVEGADRRWPANMATEEGLSIDNTADVARQAASLNHKIKFIQHGWAADKCELRNSYAEHVDDGVLVVFDADEFLTRDSLDFLIHAARGMSRPGAIRLPHVHFWKDARQVITGGYYDVPHDRAYFWIDGCRYLDNHNHPCLPDGRALWELHHKCYDRMLLDRDGRYMHNGAAWLHYGFVKDSQHIKAKNNYYLARGEATTRPGTTRDRAAWFQDGVPENCRVLPYGGPWPEIFST